MLDYSKISIRKNNLELCGNTIANQNSSGFHSDGLEICKWEPSSVGRECKYTIASFEPYPKESCYQLVSCCDRLDKLDDWESFGYLVDKAYELLESHSDGTENWARNLKHDEGTGDPDAITITQLTSTAQHSLSDNGWRITYGGNRAMREPTTGNGRFDLLCTQMLYRQALHNERGSIKYADRNWEKGMPVSRCMDSALRHMVKYMMGCNDEPHLDAAIWNLAAITYYEHKYPELMDLPERASMPIEELQKYCVTEAVRP